MFFLLQKMPLENTGIINIKEQGSFMLETWSAEKLMMSEIIE